MKINICSCCEKVIEENVNTCKKCGACICDKCKKNAGYNCILCGN